MAFKVATAGFEGPFDLLLQLVSRQKVDIGAVSVGEIADQYLAEVARMGDLDLEVASDFVLVAATLLDLKAAALVPQDAPAEPLDPELAGLDPASALDVLVERLMVYRTFRGAAAALVSRQEAEARTHARTAGPDPEFLGLMPDYLEGVALGELARLCAGFLCRKETLLLHSEHIAAKRIPLEERVGQVDAQVRAARHLTFEDLVSADPSLQNRVVSFLALLELNKRRALTLEQASVFGTILIDAADPPPEGAAQAGAVAHGDEGEEGDADGRA